MIKVTTHVLDTTLGRPATGIPVTMDLQIPEGGWRQLANAVTDSDGRVRHFAALGTGTYRLTFDIASYQEGFHPQIVVVFRVENPAEHYHVPVLLSKFGYTTYRGS